MQYKIAILRAVLFSSIFGVNSSLAIQSSIPGPPNPKFVDPYGVNLESGQITLNLETVSIGGNLGLSHSVTGYANNFYFRDYFAYRDKYSGSAKSVTIINESDPGSSARFMYNERDYKKFQIRRVSGPAGSEDFVRFSGGEVANYPPFTSGITFKALRDQRNTLEFGGSVDSYLIWVTADGARLHYDQSVDLNRIEYPNGFAVDINSTGVTSNTGFQLKYDYVEDSRPLSNNKITNSPPYYAWIPDSNPEMWSMGNPKYIRGINNAIEYCPREAALCELENDWPTATFTYPGGMPRAVYIGESVFTVENARGGVTELHFESQDVMLQDVHDPDSYIGENPYRQGYYWEPRLVAIKSAGSEKITHTYEYRNRHSKGALRDCTTSLGLCAEWRYWQLTGSASTEIYGEIKKAVAPSEGEASYTWGQPANQGMQDMSHGSASSRGSSSVVTNYAIRGLRSANLAGEGAYSFDSDNRNFISGFTPIVGPKIEYHYDDRGNLIEAGPEGLKTFAEYPEFCTSATRKTCNKPSWTKDAKGNRTDYTYHQPSGQVAIVTGPPDRNGIRPQTRYTYEQRYAYYKKNGESIERADTPIWLKTRESYCRTTAASGDGCTGGSEDEVVTTYSYGPQDGTANNLFLRSVSVTAMGDETLETRTTCYQYDIYGNQIGETRPKGNAGICPQ